MLMKHPERKGGPLMRIGAAKIRANHMVWPLPPNSNTVHVHFSSTLAAAPKRLLDSRAHRP